MADLWMRVRCWPIGRRLLAISFMSLLPIAILLWGLVSEKLIAIRSVELELTGKALLEPYRDAAMVAGSQGGPAAVARLDAAKSAFHADFGNDVSSLIAKVEEAAHAGGDIDRLRDQLLDVLMPLLTKVSFISTLSLDPELDSHYLADAVDLTIPRMVQRMAPLSTLALDVMEHGMGSDDRTEITLRLSALKDAVERLKFDFAASLTTDGRLRDSGTKVLGAVDAFVAKIDFMLENPITRLLAPGLRQAHVDAMSALAGFADEGSMAVTRQLEARRDRLRHGLFLSLGISLAVAAGAFMLTLIVQRKIGHEVASISATVGLVHQTGDLTLRTAVKGHDDLASLGNGLNELLAEMARSRAVTETAQQRLMQAEEERSQAIAASAGHFEAAVKEIISGLTSGVTELQASAGSLAQLAEQSSEKAESIANRAQGVSDVTLASDSAMQQLDGRFADMERGVQNAEKGARRAVEESRQAGETIRQLSDQAGRIGEIVELINSVSRQTNLLALNATIEAARAGEAGRGFVVVANEVKALAGQAQRATDQIAASIQSIQAGVGIAVEAIRRVGATISEISSTSTDVGETSRQQREVLSVVSEGVKRTAGAVQGITEDIGQARDGARETDSAARAMSQTADDLGRQAAALEAAVRGVVDTLRGQAA